MPKKTRSAKQKHSIRQAKEIQRKYSRSAITVTTEPQLSANMSSETQRPLNHYRYLTPELRRIGILAGVIIIILIALSQILD